MTFFSFRFISLFKNQQKMELFSQKFRDKIIEANTRGLVVDNKLIERLDANSKSQEKILSECLENGFSREFCDFVRDCNSGRENSLDKVKIIENLKKCEDPSKNAEIIGMMLQLIQIWITQTRGFELRFNQLVAVCGLIFEVRNEDIQY